MSLASGGAARRGRNAPNSMMSPCAMATRNAATSAGPVLKVKPNWPVVRAQYAYPVIIAIAPVARLITPEPR